MPVTIPSLAVTPYQIGSPAGIPLSVAAPGLGAPAPPPGTPVKYHHAAGYHTIYPLVAGEINVALGAPTPLNVLTTVAGAHSNPGDAVYLKFFQNEITSIRLPGAAGPLTLFFTDNLSGCKFYVDTIALSNDLIVYHANTTAHGPALGANADFQDPAADAILDALHLAAQGDYIAQGVAVVNAASCDKPTYFGSGGNEERRKALQGRTAQIGAGGPQFLGLCSIFGFPVGPTWQFWYQTCGDISYKRPIGASSILQKDPTSRIGLSRGKLFTEGRTHAASYATMRVYDHHQIF
jgi:hypothetical protein